MNHYEQAAEFALSMIGAFRIGQWLAIFAQWVEARIRGDDE